MSKKMNITVFAMLLAAITVLGACTSGDNGVPSGGNSQIPQDGKEHIHIAGQTECTKDTLCTECGDIMEKAKGHVPGAAATCMSPQLCTVCSVEIAPRVNHNYVNFPDNKGANCTTCESIINYKNGHSTFIPQTENSGHYKNDIKAYYAGSVLVCGDYGLEYFRLSEKGNQPYADIVNSFARKYPSLNVTSLLIPKACAYYSPEGYSNGEENQRNFINATYAMMDANIKKADCVSELSAHKGEYTYYRTDHHWTSLGAYYASRAYCNANGITPIELYEYTTVINTGYTGSLYGYAGNDANLKRNPDYTVAHLPLAQHEMTYTIGTTSYKGNLLNTNTNNYSYMFICGDQPFTHIKTTAGTGKKLIVFKESYGNAFVPFMVDYYDEIVVVDVRKDTDSVANIIENYGITDALIINNVQGATGLQKYIQTKLLS